MITIYDTAVGSLNIGDQIIMDAVIMMCGGCIF